MLPNQTDVAVDEELERVRDRHRGQRLRYEYSSGETIETSSETEACLQLGLRMHTVPNVEIYLKLHCS